MPDKAFRGCVRKKMDILLIRCTHLQVSGIFERFCSMSIAYDTSAIAYYIWKLPYPLVVCSLEWNELSRIDPETVPITTEDADPVQSIACFIAASSVVVTQYLDTVDIGIHQQHDRYPNSSVRQG
jgi:hypothetical protein